MSSTGRMRLWTPLLLAGAMTLGTGFATPAAAHCNGHNGHGHNGCAGHNGHGHHNGRCLVGFNGHRHHFNGHHHNGHHHNGHHHFNGHVQWRAVPHVHNGCHGFNGFNGWNGVGFFE
jgi:hypothetical protein